MKVTHTINTNSVQRQLSMKLKDIEGPDCMEDIAWLTATYVNTFVPQKTGALRNSVDVVGKLKQSQISWGRARHGKLVTYADYQYQGKVFGPNIPVFDESTHIGWKRSHKKRKDTGRIMGENNGTYIMQYGPNKGKQFTITGYTTPGTGHHWIEKARKSAGYRTWRQSITRLMKERWEKARKEYYG